MAKWPDQKARLKDGFYYIKNEQGKKVPFKLRPPQEKFIDDMHGLDIILKARQLGFTTVIQLLMLDECMFNPNTSAGIVAHNKDDAEAFFNDKIKFAYDALPEEFKKLRTATTDRANSLAFNNGSKIRVGTSLRSGTLQWLHISEYGKLCAKFPEKAREVQTGALNTVHEGSRITIESTAEGQGGNFYDMCQVAQTLQQQGTPLSTLDFKFHFFPWWEDAKYTIDHTNVIIPGPVEGYFGRLKEKQGYEFTLGQVAWYSKKLETQREDMKREFPSTPEEAFEAAIEGAYYHHELNGLRDRNQIRAVDFDPKYPVSTFWDIGTNDKNVMWFYQNQNGRHCMINYYENRHFGVNHYADKMAQFHKELGYRYDVSYLPHDGGRMSWSTGEERDKTLERISGVDVVVVERVQNKLIGIQAVRNVLPTMHFDEQGCSEGLKHLQRYRKEFDDKRGEFKSQPLHDDSSNGADGFRTFAEANSRGIIRQSDDYGDWGYAADQETHESRSEVGGY